MMQGCVHNCFVRIAVPGNRRRLIAGIGNHQTECLEVDRMMMMTTLEFDGGLLQFTVRGSMEIHRIRFETGDVSTDYLR